MSSLRTMHVSAKDRCSIGDVRPSFGEIDMVTNRALIEFDDYWM